VRGRRRVGQITLELGSSHKSGTCPCCGGETWTANGFLYLDGDANAVYLATWALRHPESGIDMAIGLGDWGEDAGPEDRYCVGLYVRDQGDDIQFTILDPENSGWSNSEVLGRMMTRQESLAHPEIGHVFHLADHIVRDDPRIKEVLEREAKPKYH
jgi:hypothetical protein